MTKEDQIKKMEGYRESILGFLKRYEEEGRLEKVSECRKALEFYDKWIKDTKSEIQGAA